MKTDESILKAAEEEAEAYFAAHPAAPSAERRPKIFKRSATWVALLGPDIETGLSGFGATVEAALRAFDARYHASLHPPKETSAP